MLPYFADRARESSSSEGTGDFTLGGAFPGYQTFADGGAEGETVDYAIEAVDADGIPTGQWETGKGSYSAGVLTRTTPEDGSEALPVDFGPGTKNVFITVTAVTFDMLLANDATGTDSLSILSAATPGDRSTAVGIASVGSMDYTAAFGYGAQATAKGSSALGFATVAAGDYSVALGSLSTAPNPWSVSVGYAGHERTIEYVADGTAPHHAATVGQLPTSVATLTTPRNIGGISFDGSANIEPSVSEVARTTSWTLGLSDRNTIQVQTHASPQTCTIPPQSSVTWVGPTTIIILAHGAGTCTLDADTGVTLNGVSGGSVALNRYQNAVLRWISSDVWVVSGTSEDVA